MYLGYFTEEAHDVLFTGVADNTENYQSSRDWLGAYFKSKGVEVFEAVSTVRGEDFSLRAVQHLDDAGKSKEDIQNVQILYEALRHLTPLQASNKYLWTWLCHRRYGDYIRTRWMKELRGNTIKKRFFVRSASDLWNDNALSRLWWYGYFTYDKDSDDPYELTKILLTNQTLATDVIDTLNRMNPTRIKGVLYGLRDYMDTIGTTRGLADEFRECKKYLNRWAAVTSFDYLDYKDIEAMTLQKLVDIHRQRRQNGSR